MFLTLPTTEDPGQRRKNGLVRGQGAHLRTDIGLNFGIKVVVDPGTTVGRMPKHATDRRTAPVRADLWWLKGLVFELLISVALNGKPGKGE